jgi:hypothetical protein
MRKLALGLTIAFVFLACNKASEADVDEGIKLWGELWDGYFKSLEDNQSDPDAALAAGQKYIDDSKDKIGKVRTLFNKRGTQARIDKVKAAVQDGMSTMTERLGEVGKAIAAALMEQPDMTAEKGQAAVMDFAEKVQAQAESLFKQIQG